jgi:hypothetical protein
MRWVDRTLPAVLACAWLANGCSDPQCRSSEVLVGNRCVSIERGQDGGEDPAGEQDVDGDAGKPEHDTGTPDSGSVPEGGQVDAGESLTADAGTDANADTMTGDASGAVEDAAPPSEPMMTADTGMPPVDPCVGAACDKNATCASTSGSAVCSCTAPYVGDGQTCTMATIPPVDPCAAAACDKNATCSSTSGSAVCTCTAPFVGDGKTCAMPVDPCTTAACDPNATCTSASGTAVCTCTAPYLGNGKICAMPVDPCTTAGCDKNATCSSASGTAVCTCTAPYLGNGKTCALPVDPCSTAGCDMNATCSSASGAAVCTCTAPYIGDGKTCASCATVQCGANSACNPATATCDCSAGYQKDTSGACIDIDECLNASFCTGGKVCTNIPGSAQCACPAAVWSANLLADPGFEAFPGDLGVVWIHFMTGQMDGTTYTAGAGRSGKSARVTLTSGVAGGVRQRFTLNANSSYIFSAWLRAKDNTAMGTGMEARIQVSDSATGLSQHWAVATTLGAEWHQVTLPITGLGGTVDLWIMAKAGTAYTWIDFDDVSLVEQTSTCQ